MEAIGNVVTIYIDRGSKFKEDLHILSINYFKDALSYFNLSKYTILLLSDYIEESIEFIKPLNIKNLITSKNIIGTVDNKEQFILFSASKIRICSNSILALVSCYMNEIHNFVDSPLYIIPDIWFSKNIPENNIKRVILKYNPNFYIIPESRNMINSNSDLRITKNINLSQEKFKCCVIFFHKNINRMYKKRWINKCVQTILDQTYSDFDIFEINYGSDNYSIFDGHNLNKKHYFFVKDYKTHTEAMLFLLNICFEQYNYDIVFNTNLDDYYHLERFNYQLNDIVNNNSFINSSCWQFIQENNNEDEISFSFKHNSFFIENSQFISKKLNNLCFNFDNSTIRYKNIKENILNKNNILNHSGICFTNNFWNSFDKNGNYLRYRDEKPFEDFSLWKRTCENNIPINIINKNLIFYRIHENQIGTKSKEDTKDDTFKKELIKGKNIFGILIEIHIENDIDKILYCEEYILKGENKFYYIYCNNFISEKVNKIIFDNKILNFKMICYKHRENLKKIIKLFDISVIYKSDYFLHLNKTEKINKQNIINNHYFKSQEILNFISSSKKYITEKNTTFVTMIYKIKSKFDFNQYIEWGGKFD